MKLLTIGQIARLAGVGVETVRFYERQGLIDEPARRASGYRQYGEEIEDRLRFIREAKELGFTLNEIRELLSLKLASSSSCAEVKERAEVKLAEIEEKMRKLRRMKRSLLKLVSSCSGEGSISECPILESLDGKGSR